MVHVRARGEVEELVVKTVWNVGADTCTLGVIPDLRRWTAQSLVVVDAAALARVFVVNVLLFVAVVWLHSAPTLARRVFLNTVHTDLTDISSVNKRKIAQSLGANCGGHTTRTDFHDPREIFLGPSAAHDRPSTSNGL